jgi:UDP-N-acetylmuramoyl-L-alanyl-D-glutamate--2,6-diaminopimelate ligase
MTRASIHSGVRELRQLLAGLPVTPRPAIMRLNGLTDDSRRLAPGDLFLGLKGQRQQAAERHLADAFGRGATAAVIEAEGIEATPPEWAGRIYAHPQLGRDASEVAARFHGHPSQDLSVVGVTGTNGKSTVTHILAQALEHLAGTGQSGVLGTLGNGRLGELSSSSMTTLGPVDVQAALHSLSLAGVTHVAMEVSSHALDQHRVDATRFRVAVFTNLTRDHLDYHGDMQRYAEAKLRLFRLSQVEHAVVNLDDPLHADITIAIGQRYPVLGFSLRNGRSFDCVSPSTVCLRSDGIELSGNHRDHYWQIESPLIGEFNAANLLAALATLIALGHAPDDAARALGAAGPVCGRLERIGLDATRPQVVVDYAHTPDALEKVLQTLRKLGPVRLWCVFGCGGDRDRGKRPMMAAVASVLADRVVVTSDNPRSESPEAIIDDILVGMADEVEADVVVERSAAIRQAIRDAGPGDIVLIAGKGHENYQEIAGQRLPFRDQMHALDALAAWPAC